MKSLKCNIAGLKILLKVKYDRTYNQALAYAADDWEENEADWEIFLTEDFLEQCQEKEYPNLSMENVEYMMTGSLFYRKLLSNHGVMLHSSAVVVDGYAYLFSADSGTGKSTHTGLWLKHFEDAYILNDDKPAIRKVDGDWYAFGTPWSGKYDISRNEKVKLGGVVFLERSEDNWIREATSAEAVKLFLKQTTRKLYRVDNMDKLLNILDELITERPMYRMGCNISDDAVTTAYDFIRRERQ
ncbi:MAG: hypothetical protein IKN54_00660 [Lachnospiraceae bacterium]|nr:hypothetical protein [Lachnospiraceae bacterium]